MNSHKQLPKCILKNFSKNGRLFSYDVLKGTYSATSAKQFNAAVNYYSAAFEQQLSQTIERPLGVLVSNLKKEFDSQQILIKKRHVQTIYNYIYSLLARSPNMFNSVYNGLIFKEFYTLQQIHDFTVADTFNLMQQDSFLNSYKITFLFNRTADEILLTSDGYTQYQSGGQEVVLIVPVSPQIAFMLYKGTNVFDGKIVHANMEYLLRLNTITIEQQRQHKQGYVLASEKEQLVKVIEGINTTSNKIATRRKNTTYYK